MLEPIAAAAVGLSGSLAADDWPTVSHTDALQHDTAPSSAVDPGAEATPQVAPPLVVLASTPWVTVPCRTLALATQTLADGHATALRARITPSNSEERQLRPASLE